MDKFVNFNSYYGHDHWQDLRKRFGNQAVASITAYMARWSHNPPRTIKQCIAKACAFHNVSWSLNKTVYTFGSTKYSVAPKLEFYSKPKILYWQGNTIQLPHIAELFPYLREISVWQGRLEYLNKQYQQGKHPNSPNTALDYINSLLETPITLPVSEDLLKIKPIGIGATQQHITYRAVQC